ncbi:MAG: hypothetical protein GX075_13045 [Firmicutes bacterium]|nr:hypothetical protein [Bacillota bacterium]
MGYYQSNAARKAEIASQRLEQLDLIRRLSCKAFPRADRSNIKLMLFILGLLADDDTGEEVFKIMRRF